jgi:hypothetical protein
MLNYCQCGHSRLVHTRLRHRYRCNTRNCYCMMYMPVVLVKEAGD